MTIVEVKDVAAEINVLEERMARTGHMVFRHNVVAAGRTRSIQKITVL